MIQQQPTTEKRHQQGFQVIAWFNTPKWCNSKNKKKEKKSKHISWLTWNKSLQKAGFAERLCTQVVEHVKRLFLPKSVDKKWHMRHPTSVNASAHGKWVTGHTFKRPQNATREHYTPSHRVRDHQESMKKWQLPLCMPWRSSFYATCGVCKCLVF